MGFDFLRRKPFHQSDPETWKRQWQSLVPPENRDVPITLDGETVIAFVQMKHYVLMLQDGLLMDQTFFSVCKFFQRAGYHVIWLMRCTQDVHNGYLKLTEDDGRHCRWLWKKPTTNFGRWTSDNYNASIVLQYRQLPQGDLRQCEERLLQRVVWVESDRPEEMIPRRTRFSTIPAPATPAQLLRWLGGKNLHSVKNGEEMP